ncbi:hypothetical protein E1A91_A01G130100v1 [Gossypium mustelinum]|uniref:Uncharacterized protein n=1 Tax=Gossypium mustelinum TaxID=34275 RepID=A0A5D3AER0_GOSMU|nr:hypothetical protein E1A91_A01G130100v1 [Gossypium mustelinum]
MCYEVKCSTCGKTTWGGCGRHVPSVYNRLPETQRCNCKEWPGVNAPQPSTSCTIFIGWVTKKWQWLLLQQHMLQSFM